MELSLDEINWSLQNEIAKLAPFGVGNPKPVFIFKNVTPVTVRRFGKGSDHVELGFKKSGGAPVTAISFFGATAPWADAIQPNKPIDLLASIEKSMFRGRPELRLRVEDVL
jgi:single-stranded-DNA-specific exonuclease